MANNERKVRVPKEVHKFVKANVKDFMKESKGFYGSKKEARKSYYLYLIDKLPETIVFMVKFGHLNNSEIREIRDNVLKKITDLEFVKILTKCVKKDDGIENIKLLPIIIRDVLIDVKRANDARLADDANAKLVNVSDLVDLSRLILKKKIKKFEKEGISQSLAFDILSVLPCKEAFESSQFYRMRTFYETLYEHAKATKIDVRKVMDLAVPKKSQLSFITFAMLERKEKFSKLIDSQKTLYLDITNYCIEQMNEMKKDEVYEILDAYVKSRERDDRQNKDGNRRCNLLTSISEAEYPRLAKIIRSVAQDESVKKYL